MTNPSNLEDLRSQASAVIRRNRLWAGAVGALVGICALVPGLGIITGLLAVFLIELPILNRLRRAMCADLVAVYLPHLDENAAAGLANLLAQGRDPNRAGALSGAYDAISARVSRWLRRRSQRAILRLVGRILFKVLPPFGVAAGLGFLLNYWDIGVEAKLARYRLEIYIGAPAELLEPPSDPLTRWFGCCLAVLAVMILAALVGAGLLTWLLLRWIF